MCKRIVSLILAVTTVFAIALTAGCQKMSYGGVFKTQEKLEAEMKKDGLNFKYPAYMGERGKSGESQFVAIKAAEDEKYTGYKIYQFGAPFYTSVTSFAGEADKLLSDEASRTAFLKTLKSAKGDINVYSGKGHEDALYLIGIINIDGNHYEVRITSDEEMTDNKYVHAIYADNEYYGQSLDLMVKIAESIS